MSSFLSGIVLAAGASRRMGKPKLLLPLGGRPLLQHVVDAAAGSCLDEIVVVLGDAAAEVKAALNIPPERRFGVVVNLDAASGQATSLSAGLRAADARATGAAILLGDQPGIGAALIDRLARAFSASGLPVVRPVYSGANGRRLPGHPVFLARAIWPQVLQLSGDQGARALLAAHPEWVTELEVEGDPLGDVDTWEDYLRVGGSA